MLTYFYYPYGSSIDGFRILNISDDDNFVFSDEMKVLSYDSLATNRLNIQANLLGGGIETWKNKQNGSTILPFEYEIHASSADVTLNLDYNTTKRPLILGDDGYLLQGDSSYTYYYSQTRIDITGNITYNGITENISGMGWIDRQYGTLNPSAGTEYEWFSIQLSNDMDINLWNIFNAQNEIPNDEKFRIFSAYVNDSTQYTISDFNLERLSYAYMPDSLKCYAQSWRLTSAINNVDLTITALYSNSEVQSPFRFYEGATRITGSVNGYSVTGVGFVETLHSYEKPDLTLTNDSLWNNSILLKWQLNNPDEGNPLHYKLEYKTNNQNNYTLIANNISDTLYNWWSSPSFADGDTIDIKLTGFSKDETIQSSITKQLIYSNAASVIEVKNEIVSIYPNPAKDIINITANGLQKVEIRNIEGKLILTQNSASNSTKINVKGLKKGVYFIHVYTKNKTKVKKVTII